MDSNSPILIVWYLDLSYGKYFAIFVELLVIYLGINVFNIAVAFL